MIDEAHGTGDARAGRPRRAGRGRPRGPGRRDRRHARQGARLLRRVRRLRPDDGPLPGQRGADVHLLHRAAAAGGRRGPGRAGPARASAPSWSTSLAANAARCARRSPPRASTSARSRTQIVPLVVGEADRAMRICEAALARGVFAQAIRPPTVPPMTSRLRLAVMATHREEELRDAARTLGAAARACGFDPRCAATTAVGAGGRRRARGRRVPGPARRGRLRAADRRRAATSRRRRRRPARSRRVRLRGPRAGPPRGLRRAPERLGRRVRGCLVTGTDTGVGKTVLSAAIAAALRARADRRSAR